MNYLNLTHFQSHTHLELNRADVHNAFNAQFIEEIDQVLRSLAQTSSPKPLLLSAAGASFSAGADLAWMQSMAVASEADNVADALKLASLMRNLAFFPAPTIARVQGSAYGGGVGLIACCDIAIGVGQAKFGLTESRLGLVPAVISPYVISAIGSRWATRYFITGESFDAAKAQQLGLLHDVVSAEQLDKHIDDMFASLVKAGPQAALQAKKLVQRISGRTQAQQEQLDEDNARLIASLRVSPEGQEGIAAFLQKRKPSWLAG
jgi:methylglutaconyl-CoA hydratase